MKFEEIESLLSFDEQESSIFMPNEIFEDLQKSDIKRVHIPFAYSYYYLISWLYRYTKYDTKALNNKDLKKILGYNPDYKQIDYIIKKNGVLDKMGYTLTDKNFPTSWTLIDNILEFTWLFDSEEEIQSIVKKGYSRKFTVKFPVKAFYRSIESEEEGYEDGTFFQVENTHLIPFEVFMYCVDNKDIGCTGFYLWAFLKMNNQLFDNGFDISMEKLSEETGLPYRTMADRLSALRKYKLVEGVHNQKFFCTTLEDKKRKANTYFTNDYDLFLYKPMPYKKMKVVTADDYKKMKEEELKKLKEIESIDISLEELPY